MSDESSGGSDTKSATQREKETFPAPAYKASVLADIYEDAKRLFLDHMLDVDYAHVVMLAECDIITRAEARTLFVALDGLDREQIRLSVYDGSCEDLFFYIEKLIVEASGEEAAGRLHTARSRNDTDVTIYRMRLRADALALVRSAMDLRRVLLHLASAHHETIIPAYTHTQPAQPTTLAHYLLAMAEVTGRDITRLRRAFQNINQSPLGACAITTTGFPIDRARTAELLGFDAPTVNSYASIAAVDYLTEIIAASSVLLVNVGKFAQEFLLMATREFDVVRLSDGYVQTSSIMPQKRNPVALEHVRALASKSLGQGVGVLFTLHNTPFGDINDAEDDLQPLVASAMRDAVRSLSLFAAALATATFNVEVLRRRAAADFITVTELADTLVRREGLPFRTAHRIVARAVEEAQNEELESFYQTLQTAAIELIERPLSLTIEDVSEACDAENFIRVRGIRGGPAPPETRRALAAEREQERDDEAWYAQRTEELTDYPRQLRRAVEELVSSR